MANSQEQASKKEIHIWVQTIGIGVATFWGIYTFIHKEIFIPMNAPTSISLNLQLRETGRSHIVAKKKALIAIEMKASAKNTSSKTIYLLPNIWEAYGSKVEAINDDSFNKKATGSI